MVSVVMPYYNTPLALTRRALASVVAQRDVRLEVLIIDDGSEPDHAQGIRELLGEFRNDLDLRLLSRENAGPGAARNEGVTAARYDLVAFLDSDDYWSRDSLRSRLAVLEQDADAWMVCGGARVEDAEGVMLAENWGTVWVETFSQGLPLFYLNLFRVNRVNNSTVCLRKGLFRSLGGFDGELENSEDYDLWFRACRAGLEIRYLDGPVATLVHHGANFSQQVARRRRAEAFILCRELTSPPAFLRGLPNQAISSTFGDAWFRVGRYAIAEGNRKLARQAFARSYKMNPTIKAVWRRVCSCGGG